MRCGYKLSALTAHAHTLSDGDLPAAKLQRQERCDERRPPLHACEYESTQLLRQLPGAEWDYSLAYVYRQREGTPSRDCCRLWHRLANHEDLQSLRSGGLFERSPAGNFRHLERDHSVDACDCGKR